jgi:hypothetical protein
MDNLELNLKWDKLETPEYPFQLDYHGHKLQIKVNDFPDEQLYSLIVDSESICDFDNWPKNWKR